MCRVCLQCGPTSYVAITVATMPWKMDMVHELKVPRSFALQPWKLEIRKVVIECRQRLLTERLLTEGQLHR